MCHITSFDCWPLKLIDKSDDIIKGQLSDFHSLAHSVYISLHLSYTLKVKKQWKSSLFLESLESVVGMDGEWEQARVNIGWGFSSVA